MNLYLNLARAQMGLYHPPKFCGLLKAKKLQLLL